MSFMLSVIGLFRKFSKVGVGWRGREGSNMSSKAFGDSFAVRPKAKMMEKIAHSRGFRVLLLKFKYHFK
jgi:hypothetical protein